VIAVGAAPAAQDTTPITGTVEDITLETDTDTVLVTLTDEMGETQTIRLSLQDATTLGLVTDDDSGNQAPNSDAIGEMVNIDPTIVIPDEGELEEEEHPIGSAISDFFSDLLSVDYEMVMSYHDDGVGFGVIAQALWMTNALEGDTDIFAAILDAKQNKDYSGITLPDGSTPQNWGQFRQAVMKDKDKAKQNLGAIMSGRAEGQEGDTQDTQTELKNNGNEPDKDKDKDKEKDKKDNKNKDKDKGKGKDKDKGKGKDKNKDKNKNK
jgi:hypothetical protein